jgi:hypothetical protein
MPPCPSGQRKLPFKQTVNTYRGFESYRGHVKTTVQKFGSNWRCTYYLPYSNVLYVEFDSWEEAMNEAAKVEKGRGWY